jgi:hypothetical protein
MCFLSQFSWPIVSYYKLGNLCVCVSVSLSGYTFPKFSTDLLQIWRKPSTGHDTFRGLYMFCVHTMWAHVRARAWLSVRLPMDGFSSYLRWTYYISHQVAWATYFSCSRNARTHASVIKHSLIFGRIFSNLLGIYYKWPQGTWATYLSCSRTV